MENFSFTPVLDELFNVCNNTLHHTSYWVCTAGRYRAMFIFGRVHAAFFNCHQFDTVAYMLDEIVLARMMTALDLEFVKASIIMMRDVKVTMIMDYQLRL